MGCGASNNSHSPVLPVNSSPRQNAHIVATKEQSKKAANSVDNSLRGSNLNASTSAKVNASKSGTKVVAQTSKSPEKVSPEKQSTNLRASTK